MKYYIFEGPDAAGKSTVVQNLNELLRSGSKDPRTVFVREPGSTDLGERIRNLVKEVSMSPVSQVAMNFTQRFELLDKVLAPAFEQGKTVVSDRGFPSTYVYNCLLEKNKDAEEAFFAFGSLFLDMLKGVETNVVYILPESHKEYIKMLRKRRKDMDQNKRRLFANILDCYYSLVDDNVLFGEEVSNKVVFVNDKMDPLEVVRTVLEAIDIN